MKAISKKLGAIVLALVMCFSLTCVAFAADGDCTITVENSIGGVEYNVYKIFDAEYNETTGSVIYKLDASETDLFTLLNGSGLFDFDLSDDGTYYLVTATDEEEDIAYFFNNNYEAIVALCDIAADAQIGNGGAITFEDLDAGYYLIVPTSDKYNPVAVTVDTAAPDATVVDKNQMPGSELTKDASEDSVSVGDEVTYTISSYVPTYSGTELVGTYEITDTMGAGLTYEHIDSVVITGSGLPEGGETLTENLYTVVTNEVDGETVLTITWNPADIEAATGYTYPADATITITYVDLVNDAADETDLYNKVALTSYNVDGEPIPDPTPPTTEKDVYIYGFDLTKTDENNTLLTGAEFTLQKQGSDELITFLYDEESDTYEEWDGTSAGTTTTTITVSDGDVNIWGLGAGTYILTETVAPDGYNLLDAPVTIVIASTDTGWSVTVDNGVPSIGTFSDTDEHGVGVMPTVTVVNNAGSSLPSTGGMGTTIFYIIGGVLVAGAAVVLITRRRMSSES